ncbi:hypothetical protein Nepgr_028036 [Nepenthes gracilis]|uniref:Uncharacterized protein n=1 Tax=Nepenthes gracilis TaxID=150966 RepID=A0AAD3T9X3_NEPGR|nr:hypothetical protein Nepgr_028036 [Nepenthes gracilis]
MNRTHADIEAAYRNLMDAYGVKEEDIILYGQSIGSKPAVELATRLPCLRAVVLHSLMLSGLRDMYPVKRTYRLTFVRWPLQRGDVPRVLRLFEEVHYQSSGCHVFEIYPMKADINHIPLTAKIVLTMHSIIKTEKSSIDSMEMLKSSSERKDPERV